MGYPGDSNQQRQSWDGDPLDAPEDDWSRHPLSAPVPPQQGPQHPDDPQGETPGGRHGTDSSGSWNGEQTGGSWLEGAAARPQSPLDDQQWPDTQKTGMSPLPGAPVDPLAAPPFDAGTGGQAAYAEPWQGGQEISYDGPSGPQPTPWHDGVPGGGGSFDNPTVATPPPARDSTTGTHALPSYDSGHEGYDAPAYDQAPAYGGPSPAYGTPASAYGDPSYGDPAPAYDNPAPAYGGSSPSYDGSAPAYGDEARHDAERFGGGATASGSYEVPEYDAAGRPFTGAQAVPPPGGWGEPPAEGPAVPPQQAWDGPPSGPYARGEQWQPEGAREEIGDGRGGGGRKGLLIAGAAAIAVVVAGAGAWALTRDGGTPKAPVANQSSAAPENPAAGGGEDAGPEAPPAGGLLKSRKTDPRPLKLAEVFAKKRFAVKGTTYVMSIRKATKNCGAAVHGTALQAALKKGKCTQFLRATFSTKDGRMIGTVGVANLGTAQAAAKAEKAARDKDAYVVALPGKGVTAKIGQGDALGAAWTRGHYLIMTWVQTPNGKPIPAKNRKRAQIFAQNTVNGSNLGPALHMRDETGKPAA